MPLKLDMKMRQQAHQQQQQQQQPPPQAPKGPCAAASQPSPPPSPVSVEDSPQKETKEEQKGICDINIAEVLTHIHG